MLRLAILALALSASSDTLIRPGGGNLISGASGGGTPAPVLWFPFNTTGPLITEDANTVSHVYFNGSTLVDTRGLVWTEQGTVAESNESPFYPDFTGSPRYSSGPFTTSNYYARAVSPFDATGNFTACIIAYYGTGTAELISAADGTDGWLYFMGTAGWRSRNTACSVTGSVPQAGTWAVSCFGKNGNTGYYQLNQGAAATDATCTGFVNCPACSIFLGRGPLVAGSAATDSYLLEMYWTTTAFDTSFTALVYNKLMGILSSVPASPATVLTATRASSGSFQPTATSKIFYHGDNQPRITADGLVVENTGTNLARQSAALATTPWAASNSGAAAIGFTPDAGAAPDGSITADQLVIPAAPNAGDYSQITQLIATRAAAPDSASIWLRTLAGTATVNLMVQRTNPAVFYTACSVTTTWSRCTVPVVDTDSEATTLAIGQNRTLSVPNAGDATVLAWGAQYEARSVPTSYVPTTTTSGVRQVDNVTTPLPATFSGKNIDTTPACFDATATPSPPGTWSDPSGTPGVRGILGTSAGVTISLDTEVVAGTPRYYTYMNDGVDNHYVGTATPPTVFTTGTHRFSSHWNSTLVQGTQTGFPVTRIDGVQPTETFTPTTGGATTVNGNYSGNLIFGDVAAGAFYLHGSLKNVRLFDKICTRVKAAP